MVSNGWLTIAIFMVFFAPEVFGSGKEFVGVALGWRKPRKRAGGSKILMQHASRIGRRLAADHPVKGGEEMQKSTRRTLVESFGTVSSEVPSVVDGDEQICYGK